MIGSVVQTKWSVAMPSYVHLSSLEREQIAVFHAAGHSNTEIAKTLARSPATISRELRRNTLPSGTYSPRLADGAYLERRQRAAILERDDRLRDFVVQRLAEGWSPEQIAGWLQNGTERNLGTLVTETIYAFIYRASQKSACSGVISCADDDLAVPCERGHHAIPSRTGARSMIGRRRSRIAARLGTGKATSSSAKGPGPSSFFMSERRGSRSPPG